MHGEALNPSRRSQLLAFTNDESQSIACAIRPATSGGGQPSLTTA